MLMMKINYEITLSTIVENTDALTDCSKGVYLLLKAENAGQNHNLTIANISFENVTLFRYLD
jgi:hypothetical protein